MAIYSFVQSNLEAGQEFETLSEPRRIPGHASVKWSAVAVRRPHPGVIATLPPKGDTANMSHVLGGRRDGGWWRVARRLRKGNHSGWNLAELNNGHAQLQPWYMRQFTFKFSMCRPSYVCIM